MRVVTTENGWALEAIGELEWLFLERLPGTASGDELPAEKKRRLLPDPITGEAVRDAGYGDFINDWDEFVRPELNLAFTEARDQVAEDLTAVTGEAPDDSCESGEGDDGQNDSADEEDDGVRCRLEIPGDHSENWYSTLNQARLLMNEFYDLANSEERLYAAMAAAERGENEPKDETAEDGEDPDSPLSDGMLWMLLAQYQFYSFIQSFLIERVIRL